MSNRQSTDIAAAFLIGALFGIGATLLLRAREEDEMEELLRRLRRVRRISLREEPPRSVRERVSAIRERIR